MSAFAQRQNQNQEKHSKIPARSDHVNAQQNSVWDPFFTRQSAWGNQTMQRELRTAAIQAKFAVNRPSDKYEHELTHVTQQGQKVFRNDKSFGEPLVSVKLAVNKSDGERQHILQRLPEPRGVQASGISEDEIEESIEERQSGFAEEETAEQTPEEKINRLKQLYGIDFDSQKALQTLIDYRRNILNHNLPRIAEINPSQLSSYINGFSTASNNINTSVWSLAELKALDQALTFFSNSLSGLVVGKLNFGFNEQNGIWSNSTPDLFAEFIPGTILIYDAAMRKKKSEKALVEALKGDIHPISRTYTKAETRLQVEVEAGSTEALVPLFVHELSHGLTAIDSQGQKIQIEKAFAAATGYWIQQGNDPDVYGNIKFMDIPQPSSKRELRKLNKALEQQWGVRYEEPVTPYGEKGLHEDLAESILFYKLNPKALQDVAPQRYRFVQSTI